MAKSSKPSRSASKERAKESKPKAMKPGDSPAVTWLLRQDDPTWHALMTGRMALPKKLEIKSTEEEDIRKAGVKAWIWSVFYMKKVRPLKYRPTPTGEPPAIKVNIEEHIDHRTDAIHLAMLSNPAEVLASWSPRQGPLANWMLWKHGIDAQLRYIYKHDYKLSKRIIKWLWPSTPDGLSMKSAIHRLHGEKAKAAKIGFEEVAARESSEPKVMKLDLQVPESLDARQSLLLAYIQLYPLLASDALRFEVVRDEVLKLISEEELVSLHSQAASEWMQQRDRISERLGEFVREDSRKRRGTKEEKELRERHDMVWAESLKWPISTKHIQRIFSATPASVAQMKRRYLRDLASGELVKPIAIEDAYLASQRPAKEGMPQNTLH